MSPAPTLTPALALDYLRELSADIRTGVVLDPGGTLLAGPEHLDGGRPRPARRRARRPRRCTSARPTARCSPRARSAHALVVVCGRLALPSLIRYDLRVVLADLAGSPRPEAAA